MREEELARYAQTASSAGLTVSEWARQALRAAASSQSDGDVDVKLAAIRRAVAVQSGGREADIETMLAETDAGQLGVSTRP